MKKEPTLLDLLSVDRSGGTATLEHKLTGEVKTERIPVECLAPDDSKLPQTGSVSAQVEMARSFKYNKISLQLWAHTTCAPEHEAKQLKRLADLLFKSAGDYEESIKEKLEAWKELG
jgi:hypothetical protein